MEGLLLSWDNCYHLAGAELLFGRSIRFDYFSRPEYGKSCWQQWAIASLAYGTNIVQIMKAKKQASGTFSDLNRIWMMSSCSTECELNKEKKTSATAGIATYGKHRTQQNNWQQTMFWGRLRNFRLLRVQRDGIFPRSRATPMWSQNLGPDHESFAHRMATDRVVVGLERSVSGNRFGSGEQIDNK